MIEPAPTTPLAPHLARGTLIEVVPDSATRPGHIVLRIPNTSYQLHLVPATGFATPVGTRIIGTIHARAKRVDTTGTGGRFIEPVYGRPRRIQGFVVGTDPAANTITVDTGVPVICTLTDQRQHPSQFSEGQFVGFDVMDGATFEPQA
ncbi:MAG: hypothetical protein GIKADHBN_01822 [Phycisphaerales bacterium]|nr:hypothetical protein [Phycisphaerales bacterium]